LTDQRSSGFVRGRQASTSVICQRMSSRIRFSFPSPSQASVFSSSAPACCFIGMAMVSRRSSGGLCSKPCGTCVLSMRGINGCNEAARPFAWIKFKLLGAEGPTARKSTLRNRFFPGNVPSDRRIRRVSGFRAFYCVQSWRATLIGLYGGFRIARNKQAG
jgi:hypothetical protein